MPERAGLIRPLSAMKSRGRTDIRLGEVVAFE